jgi:hypothetical protein
MTQRILAVALADFVSHQMGSFVPLLVDFWIFEYLNNRLKRFFLHETLFPDLSGRRAQMAGKPKVLFFNSPPSPPMKSSSSLAP